MAKLKTTVGKKNETVKKGASAKAAKKSPQQFAEAGEFKGHKMFRIVHEEDQDFPDVALSLRKVTTLLQFVDEMKAFVASEGDSVE